MKCWRSIRKYIDKQIADETIKQLIVSGKDKIENMGDKLLSFTVIQSKEEIDRINKVTKVDMLNKSEVPIIKRLGKAKDFHIFYGAPTIIMVSVKDRSKAIGVKYSDSVHKIVERAKKLGLATHWNSFVKYHFFEKEKLGIPEEFTPYYAISIGYAK